MDGKRNKRAMALFQRHPSIEDVITAAVATSTPPTEALERETYQPPPYTPPPTKPPRKNRISRGLLYAGIGATILGLAAAAAVFGSRAAAPEQQPTPTASSHRRQSRLQSPSPFLSRPVP